MIIKKGIIKFFKTIISSFTEKDGKGSGKRFTLFACVAFLGWVVVVHTTPENATTLAGILSSLIAGLAGVTAYHSYKKNVDK